MSLSDKEVAFSIKQQPHFKRIGPIPIPAIAWAMALMVSPDNLILLGHIAGNTGGLLPLFLILTGAVYVLNIRVYAATDALFPGKPGELHLFQTVYGKVPALCLSLFIRLGFACLAATSILVASGYVFNEVFVYWFPNFAAAFILLGGLLLVNLIGPTFSSRLQTALLWVVFGALGVLLAAGLIGMRQAAAGGWPQQPMVSVENLLPVVLLYMGIDLAYINHGDRSPGSSYLVRSMIISLVAAGILFCLWGSLSWIYVAPHRLVDTSIPHIVTARTILGQEGRILIGIVIIAGSSAAVNALLQAVTRTIHSAARMQLLPEILAPNSRFRALPLLTTVAVIAAMMALGVAGSESLDIHIRAVSILWLLLYAALHTAVAIHHYRTHPQTSRMGAVWAQKSQIFAMAALSVSAIGLMVEGSQPFVMLRFVVAILGFSAVISWGLIRWAR